MRRRALAEFNRALAFTPLPVRVPTPYRHGMTLRRRDFICRRLAVPVGLARGAPYVPAQGAQAAHGAHGAQDASAVRSRMDRRLMAFLDDADREDLALDPQAAVLRGDTSRAHDFGDYSLYLHEGIPGHHLQGSLAQEGHGLPPLLRFSWNVGYGEGWGLYAEQLGHEMGRYNDPVAHLGALDMEIFRAARLVVDTGLHDKAWPRARAVEYLVANTSLERTFCENEVDRCIARPGQATGCKLGEITIRRLRRKAEGALGKRFDVKRFHTQVLDTGAVPLEVLAMKIDAWIREGGS
jgi:uncharacterized protein (DUF885 family)